MNVITSFLTGWKGYLLIVIIGISIGWTVNQWRNAAKLANIQQAQAMELARAVEQARAIEKERWDAREQIIKDARKELENAQATITKHNAVNRRLRDQIATYEQNAGNTTITTRSLPAEDAIGVLAIVLGELNEQAGEVARYADQARIAGLTCQKAYNSLIESIKE